MQSLVILRVTAVLIPLFLWGCAGSGGGSGAPGVVFGRILGIPSKYDVSVVLEKVEAGKVVNTKTIFLQPANDFYQTDLNFAWKLKSGDWLLKSFTFEGVKTKKIIGEKKPVPFAEIKGRVVPQNPHKFYLLPGKNNYIGTLKFIGFETVHSNIDIILAGPKDKIAKKKAMLDKKIKIKVIDKFGRARSGFPEEFPKFKKEEIVRTKMSRVRTFNPFSSQIEYRIKLL